MLKTLSMKTAAPQTKTVERPPIITIMGHIDHGKSTLLDYIRKTNVVAGEAGGITQHLSAYEALHTAGSGMVKSITFLDTPGHAAFSAMRSRGAHVADIAVLVVSAEDGVKPQTLEALEAIKSAGIPFIVAVTKIDKPNANVERTKQDLAEHGVYIEGYGGDIPTASISAKTGEGVSELLDLLLLVAEMAELSGDPGTQAEGVVIESHLDHKRGIGATLIVQNGTLKRGGYVVAEDAFAPLRIMETAQGKTVDTAGLSSPVRVTGWQKMPRVGSRFTAVASKRDAEAAARADKETSRTSPEQKQSSVGVDADRPNAIFPLIIKTDTVGTLEAVENELSRINVPGVELKFVSRGVGTISENDCKLLAGTKGAVIAGFRVGTDGNVSEIAERSGVDIKVFDVIYKISEWLAQEMEKRVPRVEVEEVSGEAQILRIFSTRGNKQVTGGRVVRGTITVASNVRITRRGHEIGRGKILELQRQKLPAGDVAEGTEFGALVESKIEIAPGDTITSYVRKLA